MKKIGLIFAFISTLIFGAVYQGVAQDAKAKTILQNFSSKIKSSNGVKSNFKIVMNNASGKQTGSHSGTLQFKGNKYNLALGEQTIISDGKSTWTYIKSNNEVQITSATEKTAGFSPKDLFAGAYDKDYNYKFIGEKTVAGVVCNVIELTPKASSGAFKKVILNINKANNTLVGGTMTGKGGETYNYTLSNLNMNASLAESLFTFNAKSYPGVDVIDLR